MRIPDYYENLRSIRVNTLPDKAYFIPYAAAQEAESGDRARSSRLQTLNGLWRFAWYPNVESVPEGFYMPAFDETALGYIDVPGCWQTQGYDTYHYDGARMVVPIDPPYVPAEIPCGAYIRDFDYRPSDIAPVAELTFEGVDACYYVWLNGHFVGYSEVSHALSAFDVTQYLKNGANRLAVLNLKWCKGTYFEIQDKFRMSGIFRDVYLTARPKDRLLDLFVRQSMPEDCSKADLDVEMRFAGGGEAAVRLKAPDGRTVCEAACDMRAETHARFSVDAPLLWNAEQPNLYALHIETPGEAIVQRVGFRTVGTRDGVFTVNGRPVKLRGVNRHDTDPLTGYAVNRDHMLRDLTLMKRNNINAIRTSHYPSSPLLLELANEMGFYVMSEADHETNEMVYKTGKIPKAIGGPQNNGVGYRAYCPELNDDPRYEEMALDRMCKNVRCEKNQPCVVMWSLGNESGWGRNFELAGAWIRRYDPSRPIHYENLYPGFYRKPDYSCLGVLSRMYPGTKWIQEKYGDIAEYDYGEESLSIMDDYTEAYYKDKMRALPFLLCEYSHAMGNSNGDAEDYQRLILSHDRFAGGFIWEWADHAKYVGTDRAGKPMYQYGGDSGEFPHDGAFCMDGLNFPDRRPHTGLMEYKNVIRPIRAAWDQQNKTVRLRNCHNFLDAKDALRLRYEVKSDGEPIREGSLDMPSIPAGEERVLELPFAAPARGAAYLRLIYENIEVKPFMPVGFELGFDQLAYETEADSSALRPAARQGVAALTLRENERRITVAGQTDSGPFEYTFDKRLGSFICLCVNGKQLLSEPIGYNISRAPTDNDRGFGKIYADWINAGYYDARARVYSARAARAGENVSIEAQFGMAAVYRGNCLKAKAVYTVSPDGAIDFECDVRRDTGFMFLPRFGIRLFLNGSADRVRYFGYGPTESYIDKHHACYRDLFEEEIDASFEDYVRPQESGSHYDCAYLEVSGADGARLRVQACGQGFSFNASRYAQEDLTAAAHNYELRPRRDTVVCLDYKMSGIGSNSCGPMLLKAYQLCEEDFTMRLKLLPG